MMKDKIDNFDRKMLHYLQVHGDIGPAELSVLIHLSPSQCSRRLQRLKQDGYIERTATLLNPERLNLAITAYIAIKLKSHDSNAQKLFQAKIENLSEVVSCDYLTGETDFMLRIYTKNLESYSEFLSNKLLTGTEIDTVRSSIILKQMKNVTALSLDFC